MDACLGHQSIRSYFGSMCRISEIVCSTCAEADHFYDEENLTAPGRWVCPDCGRAWVSPDDWMRAGERVCWTPEDELWMSI